MANAKLYIIGTPLGNRNDITLRALEILKTLKIFFVEDSREFRKLLDLHGIDFQGKFVHSYSNHNMKEANEKAVRFLSNGEDVGLCSDRGMPAISDPGALLVASARAAGAQLVPIPGPSSVTTVLATSGFNVDRFVFLGFLPSEKKTRGHYFARVKELGLPCAFFESPRRIRETVAELRTEFPNGQIFFGREMTKLHETFTFESLAEINPDELSEQGEYSVVFDPGEQIATVEDWEREISTRLLSDKEWAKQLSARYDVAANVLYNALQQRKSGKS